MNNDKTGMNKSQEMHNEARLVENDTLSIIEGGLEKYKDALKVILQNAMENLYGGGKNGPQCNEDNEKGIIEIWNKAVEYCINIVKDL